MTTPTVLKLGGSLITDKSSPETVDGETLGAAVEAIADATPDSLVVVHGGGSFGHHHAHHHGVTTTAGTQDPTAITDIHGAMRRLNTEVVGSLHDHDQPAVPIAPLSMATRDSAGGLGVDAGPVRTALREGFLPVCHGDVITHAGAGATILSGDELAVALAADLGADRIGMCSGVPGVFGTDGTVIDRIEDYASVADALGESAAPDVSGGMAGKVMRLLDADQPAAIFGIEDLTAFLAGQLPGTSIRS